MARPLRLLKKATWKSLIARRDLGGLLVAASKLATSVQEQTQLFRQVLDFAYNAARLHMKLWVYWPRIAKMLQDRAGSLPQARRTVHHTGLFSMPAHGGFAGKMVQRFRCSATAAAGFSRAATGRHSGTHRAGRDAGATEPHGTREDRAD